MFLTIPNSNRGGLNKFKLSPTRVTRLSLLATLICSTTALSFAGEQNQRTSGVTESHAGPANAESKPSTPSTSDAEEMGRLWIAVHLPTISKATWVSDDMAETFADTIASVLRAQGFTGKIGTLRPEDSAPSRASVLIVRLITWTAKDGVADCTFTASLRTSNGDHDLGVFSGDNLIVTADGEHRISSDGLLGSAREAMNDLYSRLRATGLLRTDGTPTRPVSH